MEPAQQPTGFPSHPRFEIFGATLASRHVSGDWFEFFQTPDGALVVVIADASGKGVPAAMFLAAARALVRDLAMRGGTPARVLMHTNRTLVESNPHSMFVTALLLRYDLETGVGVAANAGHPPAFVFSPDGPTRDVAEGTGTVLGALEALTIGETSFTLAPGESLVLVSDGITEGHAANARAGAFFGREGVRAVCARYPGAGAEDVCRELLQAIADVQAGDLHDDATVVVLRRTSDRR